MLNILTDALLLAVRTGPLASFDRHTAPRALTEADPRDAANQRRALAAKSVK